MRRLTFEDIKYELEQRGLSLLSKESEYKNSRSYVCFVDQNGYRYSLKAQNIPDITVLKLVGEYNIYSIYNINQYLKNTRIGFKCVSEKYVNATTDLEFECTRCNTHTFAKWYNINRKDNNNRNHIVCPSCGGRTESLHALVLKQMFQHEYPDTVVEDRSCINPKTQKALPTDIVNHRLMIAIEVQSQWHDYADKRCVDQYKRDYWVGRGYKFYAPDIRDYSVLGMCQLFFNIDELPQFIDYGCSDKINIKKTQDLLNDGVSIPDIADECKVDKHRIYDALYDGRLIYPHNYRNACFTSIVQLDRNGQYLCEYESLSTAERESGVNSKAIGKALRNGKHYSGGYYWFYQKDYNPETIRLSCRFAKFHIPVNKYDLSGEYLCTYNTIIEASKDNNVSNTQIYNVVNGVLKQTGGYIYKAA